MRRFVHGRKLYLGRLGCAGDLYSTNAGCTAQQYGNYYRIACSCNYPPPPSCSPDGSACSDAGQCCSGYCNTDGGACGLPGSPILINLGGNSADDRLTSAADGVAFDIDADGVAERVAWTSAESPVAFLVLDRNGNGTIDNGLELFGTATRKRDGTIAANGFDALLDLDGGLSASDGKIDTSDAIYPLLRLWVDRNHNGVSEPNELMTLFDAVSRPSSRLTTRAASVTSLETRIDSLGRPWSSIIIRRGSDESSTSTSQCRTSRR